MRLALEALSGPVLTRRGGKRDRPSHLEHPRHAFMAQVVEMQSANSFSKIGSMPRRAASVTQADIARAIRAAQAAGLPVLRIVVRADGVAVETTPQPDEERKAHLDAEVADSERVVVL